MLRQQKIVTLRQQKTSKPAAAKPVVVYKKGENGQNGVNGLNGLDGVGIEALSDDGERFSLTLTDGRKFEFVKPAPLTGERGLDGKPGRDGRDGKDGVDGKNGRDGKDGEQGPQGVGINVIYSLHDVLYVELTDGRRFEIKGFKGDTGERGSDGKQGLPGEKGADGVGISQVRDAHDYFELVLTNGLTKRLKKLEGPQGAQGPAGGGGGGVSSGEGGADGAAGVTEERVIELIQENDVYDDYAESEYLDEQAGDGTVKTFTFSAPVQFAEVEMIATAQDIIANTDAISTLEGRAAFGVTPTAIKGAVLKHEQAKPLFGNGDTVYVLAPANTRIIVSGARRVAVA